MISLYTEYRVCWRLTKCNSHSLVVFGPISPRKMLRKSSLLFLLCLNHFIRMDGALGGVGRGCFKLWVFKYTKGKSSILTHAFNHLFTQQYLLPAYYTLNINRLKVAQLAKPGINPGSGINKTRPWDPSRDRECMLCTIWLMLLTLSNKWVLLITVKRDQIELETWIPRLFEAFSFIGILGIFLCI